MEGTRAVLTLWLLGSSLASSADWLSERGDSQRSGWQKRERALNPGTVKSLRVLWTRRLESTPQSLTAPTILGRTITHRGTVELVFVAGATGVYAVDGDFGTLFWKRDMQAASIVPVLTPPPPGFDEDEDDDAPQPVRPLYAVSLEGVLHALHPGDGRDLSSWKFLPSAVQPSSLNLAGSTVYTNTQGGVWSMDVSSPNAKALFAAFSGDSPPNETTFSWKGRDLRAGLARDGRIVIREAGRNVGSSRMAGLRGELSTCEDASGERWIFAVQGRSRSAVAAFRMDERQGAVTLRHVWSSPNLTTVSAPVVAGGMVFCTRRQPLQARGSVRPR